MIISKACRSSLSNSITKLRYAHTAAKTSNDEFQPLQKQDLKASKKTVGIEYVVSAENYSPLTHLTVAVRAGPRYEGPNNMGISHCLRNCSNLSSKKSTSFGLTRMVEKYGGRLRVTANREFLFYSLECLRDHVNTALPVLGEIVSQQAFKLWQVDDSQTRLKSDLAIYAKNHEAVLMEALHQAAFKNGLSNSLYVPEFMIGKYTPEMLHEFVGKNFLNRSAVVAGLGLDHQYLEDSVEKNFTLKESEPVRAIAAKFRGGEVRVDADNPITRVAIVSEGASILKPMEVLSRGVLQCILGIGPQTPNCTLEHSVLGSTAAKQTAHPFTVSSLNVSYSDCGMFGVYIAGHPNEMRQLVKAVVGQMREVTKKVSDEDVEKGKHALKAKLMMDLRATRDYVENLAMETLISGGVPKKHEEILKAIDALTATEVNAVAGKIMKSKPAMAAFGNLHNTPYLDELL